MNEITLATICEPSHTVRDLPYGDHPNSETQLGQQRSAPSRRLSHGDEGDAHDDEGGAEQGA